MNKSQRISTEVGTNADKHLKIKLEEGAKTLEILSLNIDQKDVFQFFNCDYGVLVGRVIANGGVGIPNAKVSIFIPITDEDKQRSEITALYPYETPRQVNVDGKRYNLLPRVATTRIDGTVKPKQPFGSFPTKEEVVTNDTVLEVYDKYYKYSTVTNDSGDYMLFGVPVGVQTVHMSVDITDIGRFSMTPAAMVINLGYSPNLFTDNNTRIKESNDLQDLPNIETQEISVDVIPFCGDSENFDIGITRQDFRIRAQLVSTFTVFGTAFSDGSNSMWAQNFDNANRRVRELYRIRETDGAVDDDPTFNRSIASKRIGLINERLFSVNNDISDADVQSLNFDEDSDMTLITQDLYSRFIRNGDFTYIINCNRRKIITNEVGEDVVVPNDFPDGVFTEFAGFMTYEILDDELPMDFTGNIGANTVLRPFRYKYKIPQSADRNDSFTSDDNNIDTQTWKRTTYTFEFNKIYSVARFHGYVQNEEQNDNDQNVQNGFSAPDNINDPFGRNPNWGVGGITTDDGVVNDNYPISNSEIEFPDNSTDDVGNIMFAANWMNFCIYFIQVGNVRGGGVDNVRNFRSNTNFTQEFKSDFFYRANTQSIGANQTNTIHYARSDLHYTDFIEVPVQDILSIINETTTKGFTDEDVTSGLIGDYRNGFSPVPQGGGKLNGQASNPTIDPRTYFFKGFEEANCIEYLVELGII